MRKALVAAALAAAALLVTPSTASAGPGPVHGCTGTVYGTPEACAGAPGPRPVVVCTRVLRPGRMAICRRVPVKPLPATFHGAGFMHGPTGAVGGPRLNRLSPR